MGIFKSIKNFFFPSRMINVQLDPETVKRDNLVKALSYENASLKSERALLEKQLGQLRVREEDKQEEEKVKVFLNQEKKELQKNSVGKVFSLRAFFERYLKDSKFRRKLGFYTWDRSTRISDFEDFCISENGDFVLIGKNGDRVIQLSSLKDIFQSVSGLGVDTARGIIPINLDSEGVFVENPMVWEAPEIIGEGEKARYAKARKRPFYEIIQQKENRISELISNLSEAEMVNQELQNKIDQLEGNLKVNEEMAETSRKELTKNEERVVGIDRIFRNTMTDMMSLQKKAELQEESLRMVENVRDALAKLAEREGGTRTFDDLMDKLDQLKMFMQPKTIAIPQTINPKP